MKQVEQRSYNEEKSQAFLTFIENYDGSEGAKAQLQAFLADPEVNINYAGEQNQTPLHSACLHGRKDVAELLIKNGAGVNAKDEEDQTPLHSACLHGRKDVAELLVKNGAGVNAKDEQDETPLHYACTWGYKDVAELLIKNGAGVNAKDEEGQTPLHEACFNGRKDVAELLVKNGAGVNAKNQIDQTPLHEACWKGRKDVAELLVKNGADVNAKDKSDRTPLHEACSNRNKDIAELLLIAGATISQKEIDMVKELLPAIPLLPDPNREGNFLYAPIAVVKAVNDRFSGKLYTLLGDTIIHQQAPDQVVAATYEAAFKKTMQGIFGEGTDVTVTAQLRKMFEEQATILARHFNTIKTFAPSLGEGASAGPMQTTATSAGEKPLKSYVEIVKEQNHHTSLFPQPEGKVASFQELAARGIAKALVDDAVDVPEPETFAQAETLRRAQKETTSIQQPCI